MIWLNFLLVIGGITAICCVIVAIIKLINFLHEKRSEHKYIRYFAQAELKKEKNKDQKPE